MGHLRHFGSLHTLPSLAPSPRPPTSLLVPTRPAAFFSRKKRDPATLPLPAGLEGLVHEDIDVGGGVRWGGRAGGAWGLPVSSRGGTHMYEGLVHESMDLENMADGAWGNRS